MTAIINDRIDVRISREQKELIKLASEILGFKSLSEYVIYCVRTQSDKVIIENNTILKTLEDKKIFIEALLNPPAPNDSLKRAQSNYLKMKLNGIDYTETK